MRNWSNDPHINIQIENLETAAVLLQDGLVCGNLRSYGDSCYGHRKTYKLINHNKVLELNIEKKTVKVQSGISIRELLKVLVKNNLFLPVVPGTASVTVGGAVANDIHGKNHKKYGSFGNHVKQIALSRSNGEKLILSEEKNIELFYATIGGLGLTGVIEWVELSLIDYGGHRISRVVRPFKSLEELITFAVNVEEDVHFSAWLDGFYKNDLRIRGLIYIDRFSTEKENQLPFQNKSGIKIPSFLSLNKLLTNLSISAYNKCRYNIGKRFNRESEISVEKSLFPLDSITNWNILYGPNGLTQCQFVVPEENALNLFKIIFSLLAEENVRSYLIVLKNLGSTPPKGMLSFVKRGLTLALDFRADTPSLSDVLKKIEQSVMNNNGTFYICKTKEMSPETFKKCYPNWKLFSNFKDSKIKSRFWRRMEEHI